MTQSRRKDRYNEACTLLKNNQPEKALIIFKEQKQIDQHFGKYYVDADINIARCYCKLKNYSDAFTLLNKIEGEGECKTDSLKRDLHLTFYQYYKTLHSIDGDVTHLSEAKKHLDKIPDQKHRAVQLAHGVLLTLDKRYIETIQKIEASGSTSALSLLQLAYAYEKSGNIERAEALFRDVIEKNEFSSWQARISLAVMLQKQQHEFKLSVPLLKEVIYFSSGLPKEKQPTKEQLLQAYNALAIACFETPELSAQTKDYVREGLAIDKEYAPLLSTLAKLGRLQDKRGKSHPNPKKIGLFEGARHADPNRFMKNHGNYGLIFTNDDTKSSPLPTSFPKKKQYGVQQKNKFSLLDDDLSNSGTEEKDSSKENKLPPTREKFSWYTEKKANHKRKLKPEHNQNPTKHITQPIPTIKTTSNSSTSICRKMGIFAVATSSVAILVGCAVYQNYYRST